MKTQDIRSMGLAYLEVLEGKAVNKHGHDLVGQEDADVNNDKKVDSTDKYLLNRRKAISANIKKEQVEVDEALVGNQHKIDANKNGRIDAHDFKLLRGKKTQTEEKEEGAAHEKAEKKTVSAKSIKNALASAKAQAKPKSAVSLAKTPWNEETEVEEATLSAKAARAGKDIGKPGKTFEKIAAKAAEKYGSKEAGQKVAGAILKKMRANEEVELDEVSANTLGKYSIKAAQQGDKRVAGQKMADEKIRKKYGYSSDAKVAAEATEWTVFARIQEKAAETKKAKYEISNIGDDFAGDINTTYAKHTKGAHEHEPIDSKASQGEKDFVAMHGGLTGKDSGISADKNAVQNAAAVRASVKPAAGRHNDQKIGDKTSPKASA